MADAARTPETLARVRALPETLARVRALIVRHGRTAVSFQVLEPGLRYWFDDTCDACVAFADTGGAWVAAGGPIAPAEHEVAVFERFADAARHARRRPRWFGLESVPAAPQVSTLHVGEQPMWDPARWADRVRAKRSLREQLRRARAKGVTVRLADSAELRDPGARVRRELEALVAEWKDTRRMPPMAFVVRLDLPGHADDKRIWVAERAGSVVGVLAAVPICAADGWFLEDVLRRPHAPNGTVELMIDRAMRDLAADGARQVTYGLAPLARSPSRALRAIRRVSKALYDFDGLRRFKAKLLPDAWRPVYLGFPARERGVRAVADTLAAFAGGSLWRFALATLRHRAAAVTWLLAALLVPWTIAMAVAPTAPWFPSPAIQAAWIGYDVALFSLLVRLARRWRRRLAASLALAAAADFALGCVQVAAWNIPGRPDAAGWLVIAVALAAPLTAAAFLWWARGRSTLYAPASAGDAGAVHSTK